MRQQSVQSAESRFSQPLNRVWRSGLQAIPAGTSSLRIQPLLSGLDQIGALFRRCNPLTLLCMACRSFGPFRWFQPQQALGQQSNRVLALGQLLQIDFGASVGLKGLNEVVGIAVAVVNVAAIIFGDGVRRDPAEAGAASEADAQADCRWPNFLFIECWFDLHYMISLPIQPRVKLSHSFQQVTLHFLLYPVWVWVSQFGVQAIKGHFQIFPTQGCQRKLLNLRNVTARQTDEPRPPRAGFAPAQPGQAAEVAVGGEVAIWGWSGEVVRFVDMAQQPAIQSGLGQFRPRYWRIGALTSCAVPVAMQQAQIDARAPFQAGIFERTAVNLGLRKRPAQRVRTAPPSRIS